MVGRKASKPSKGKVVTARDLLKKTRSKLRKSAPKNQVDLQTLTKTKKLVIERSTKSLGIYNQNFLQDNALLLSAGIAIGDEASTSASLKWAHLSLRLRDGLATKRLEALLGIGEFLETNPKLVAIYGPRIFIELTPRIVDDDENVRSYVIDIIRGSMFENLLNAGGAASLRHFCFIIKKHLHLQLKISLSNLHNTKRLDGLRLLFYCLQFAPSGIFQDDAFISQIFPLVIRQLPVALRPGKMKDSPTSKNTSRKLTPFDHNLEPYLSKWSPLILSSLLGSLLHMSRSTDQGSQNVQHSLRDALEMALQMPRIREVVTPGDGKFSGDSIMDKRDQFPILRLVEVGVGLIRVALSHAGQEQISNDIDKCSAVLEIGLLLLHWVVAFVHLHKTSQLLRIDQVTPLLPVTASGRRLCTLLMESGSLSIGLSEILQFGKNSIICAITDIIQFLRQNESCRKTVGRNLKSLILHLKLGSEASDSEPKSKVKFAKLFHDLEIGEADDKSGALIKYGDFDVSISDHGSDTEDDIAEPDYVSLMQCRSDLVSMTCRIVRNTFPQWRTSNLNN